MSIDEPAGEDSWAARGTLAAAKARSGKGPEDRTGKAWGWRRRSPGFATSYRRLKPDDGGLYSNYGRLLGYLGRHDEAIEACRKAIKLNPDDGGAHYNLGNSLAAQGQLSGALAAFGEAQRLDRSLSQSREWQLRYHAACAAARAAAGTGKDEPPSDDAAKVKLRHQALDWLRAEYKTWDQLFQSGLTPGFVLGPQPTWTSASRPAARSSPMRSCTGSRTPTSPASAMTRLWPVSRQPSGRNGECYWKPMWGSLSEPCGVTPIPTETKTSRTGPLGRGRRQGRQPRGAREPPPTGPRTGSFRPAEAEPLFRQALEGYRKLEGPDSGPDPRFRRPSPLASILGPEPAAAARPSRCSGPAWTALASSSGPTIPGRPVSWPPGA